MSSSTLKGSSAAGLMDPYSRDRESSAGFVIHRPNYPLGEEPFHIQPQPPLTRLQAILLHKIYNSASSKRCWAEVPQRLHLRFFFSFKPQEANDFHSSFLSGYGPRETMIPVTDLLNWIPHKNRFLWDLQLILYFVKYINSASQTWFFPSFNSANRVNKKSNSMGNQDRTSINTGRATGLILFLDQTGCYSLNSRLFYHGKLDRCQTPTCLQWNAAEKRRADQSLATAHAHSSCSHLVTEKSHSKQCS